MPSTILTASTHARSPWRSRAVVTAAAAAALTFVGSTAVQADEAVAEEDIEAIHDIEAGDYLNAIADEYELDSWRPLWDANPHIDHPDLIAVGDELVVPEPDAEVESRPLPDEGSDDASSTTSSGGSDDTETASGGSSEDSGGSSDEGGTTTQSQEPAAGTSTWDRLAECESNGNWSINTGNGYYGGLQFAKSSWDAVGGTEFAAYPHEASREQQIQAGERLLAVQGWGAWPSCASQLGLR